jgi:hypothetical protein
VEPETKGAPKLVGFKTLQGSTWSDRHYLMKTAPQPKKEDAAPDAANSNKRRPKIFNINPK